jgi:3-isopropylmalate/(R)-2-methylmalate dehydratase small subunit
MRVTGTAIKFGANVDTDVILPGKYLVLIDPKELAKHAMEGLDPEFPKKAQKGVIVIGGKNFGCGSSKYSGVRCVLAESFARIFFRNAINIGLPIIECKGISAATDEGDNIQVDFETGEIQNISKEKKFHVPGLPPFIVEILTDGGLIENLRRRLNKK